VNTTDLKVRRCCGYRRAFLKKKKATGKYTMNDIEENVTSEIYAPPKFVGRGGDR